MSTVVGADRGWLPTWVTARPSGTTCWRQDTTASGWAGTTGPVGLRRTTIDDTPGGSEALHPSGADRASLDQGERLGGRRGRTAVVAPAGVDGQGKREEQQGQRGVALDVPRARALEEDVDRHLEHRAAVVGERQPGGDLGAEAEVRQPLDEHVEAEPAVQGERAGGGVQLDPGAELERLAGDGEVGLEAQPGVVGAGDVDPYAVGDGHVRRGRVVRVEAADRQGEGGVRPAPGHHHQASADGEGAEAAVDQLGLEEKVERVELQPAEDVGPQPDQVDVVGRAPRT